MRGSAQVETAGEQRGAGSVDEFVRERWPALVRFAWTLTGDRGDAEDVVQAVLERSWRHWTRIEPSGADAYLRRAIVNESISRHRRRLRRFREAPLPDRPDEALRLVSPGADPADAVGPGTGRHADLWRELQALPPRMRAVVVLRFVEDLSEAQTAAALGCSAGTVKSQTARAMARLRDRVDLGATSTSRASGTEQGA